MNKLTKSTPAWHTEAAEELNKDFIEINALEMTAARRRPYLGLKFQYVKEKGKVDASIPHGQFEVWMKKHCPAIAERTYRRYMQEGADVCEHLGWQIGQIGRFETPPHKLIELPPAELSSKDQKSQQLLLDFIDEKGKFQRVTRYKQVDENGVTARGALKGSKGCTKADRAAAAELTAQELEHQLAEEFKELTLRLLFLADAKGIGSRSDTVIRDACDAADTFSGYGRRTLAARKGAK